MKTLTKWFNFAVEQPYYEGEYQMRMGGSLPFPIRWEAKRGWLALDDTPFSAVFVYDGSLIEWRGMSEPSDEYWKTADGRVMAVGDMDESHVRNCLRLVIRRSRKRRERQDMERVLLEYISPEDLKMYGPTFFENDDAWGKD